MRKILSFVTLLLLLVNSLLPYLAVTNVFAQEASPSALPSVNIAASPAPSVSPVAISTPEPSASPLPVPTAAPSATPALSETPTPGPDTSPAPTPVASTEPAVTPTPVPDLTPSPEVTPSASVAPAEAEIWKDSGDGMWETAGNVVVGEQYSAPQNDKVKVKFTGISQSSGKLSIKEIKLTADQIAQTGALSDTAYDITSTMQDGFFYYDLTLPIPAGDQGKKIEVKYSETTDQIGTAQKVTEPEEKMADMVTIHGLNHFTVFILTSPNPDTVQRVLINEIFPSTTTGAEWVELYNNGTQPVDLTGWAIRGTVGSNWSIASLGTIPPAGRVVFEMVPEWLNNTAPETVTLTNQNGTVVDTVTISLTAPGTAVDHYPLPTESVGRKTDGVTEWRIFTTPTKGTANLVSLSAGTGLADLGPIAPAGGLKAGFPTWYKDKNGLALDLMEAADAFGISDPVDPANPFSQTLGFNAEGFWWAADAGMDIRSATDPAGGPFTGRAILVLAMEAAFAGEAAVDGEQSSFARVRIRIDTPVAGTYVVTYPYGQKVYQADAGTRAINDTIDVGCFALPPATVCDAAGFATALGGPIGPFLTWNTFNPNPVLSDPQLINPANPTRRYVGNPAIAHQITGSQFERPGRPGVMANIFHIEGPSGSNLDGQGNDSIETELFNVSGRLADIQTPVITLHGSNPVNAVQNSTYVDAGATALDDLDGNLTGSIITTGLPVDTTTLGAKTVTYTVTDGTGRTSVVTRTVNVVAAGGVDTTAPVITRLGTSPVSVIAGTPYTDTGATALDNVDGNITANIVTANPVNTAVIGTYTVTYNVSDAAGNTATPVTRTVNVVADTVAPVITVTGANPVNLLTGALYTDAGATATDNVDGNLTASIITTGLPVNTVVPGTFTVTYTVSDAAGNSASATRTVNVVNTLTGSLAAVSTINPANGYPTWYKDSAGIALQLCLSGANGLADANCTLPGAGEEPNFNPAQAVSFPTNFPGEAFWYLADSDVASAGQTGAGRVRLRYALESAFTTEAPTVDQQIAFLRVNLQRIADLVPGATYTVTHPFGQFTIHAGDALLPDGVTPNPDAGVADDGRFFRVEDGAFAAPLTNITAASFLSAATTHISKFLKQTNPVPPAGYIGDGATLSTIEAGPNGNFVRIEGPSIDVGNYDGDGNPNILTINLWTVSGKLADITAPVITVTGTNPVSVAQNAAYTDAGATATDDFDGNVTASIVTTGVPVDTSAVGAKTVTYTVADRAGNSSTATRIVNIVAGPPAPDTTAPVITRLGTNPASVAVGSVYTDAGATALDNVDGNLTASIITTGLPVNTSTSGSFTVTYTVSDAAGNQDSAARTVNVLAAPTLPTVTIASNNAINTLAKVGDVVTLTFTSSILIQTPAVTIAGAPAVLTNTVGNLWTATQTLTVLNTEGVVPFTINFTSIEGVAGVAVSATTNGSSVTFDKTISAPTGLTVTPQAPTNSTSQTWSWTAVTDTLSGIAQYVWRVVGGPSGTSATANVVTNLTTGVWTFFVSVLDAAGNQSSEVSLSLTVDQIAPTVSVVDPRANNFTGADLSIQASTNKNAVCSYSLDGANNQSMNQTGQLTHRQNLLGLVDGSHAVRFTCIDSAGNFGVSPTVSWIVATGNTLNGGNKNVTLSSQTSGQANLPNGIQNIVLTNTTNLDLSAQTNSVLAGNINIGGQDLSLLNFTSGDLTGVNLNNAQNIGGQSVSIGKAVKLSSGTAGSPISLSNSNLASVSVVIPDGTTILGPSTWNGQIIAPQSAATGGSAPSGFSVGNTVIDVGSTTGVLLFDKLVVITLAGVSGAVGYRPAGSATWAQITSQCGGTYANPSKPVFPGECYISNGNDTKIYTYHFTVFGELYDLASASTPSSSNNSSPSSSGGGGDGLSDGLGCASHDCSIHTTAASQGQVLTGSASNFTSEVLGVNTESGNVGIGTTESAVLGQTGLPTGNESVTGLPVDKTVSWINKAVMASVAGLLLILGFTVYLKRRPSAI